VNSWIIFQVVAIVLGRSPDWASEYASSRYGILLESNRIVT